MNRSDLRPGEQLIERGEHAQAFGFFERLARDPSQDAASRADAYVWLGTLVRMAPDLGDEDESGLVFYRRAWELDPENLGAALGIAETFGNCFPDHQDQASFARAMGWLLRHQDGLDEHVRQEVERIRAKHAGVLRATSSN